MTWFASHHAMTNRRVDSGASMSQTTGTKKSVHARRKPSLLVKKLRGGGGTAGRRGWGRKSGTLGILSNRPIAARAHGSLQRVQRVLVLRHGLSAWNAEGRWQGWLDAPLTAEGEAQAAARGRELAHAGIIPRAIY